MSGPTTKAVYTGDNGTAYAVRLPTWEYNLTNAGATISQTKTPATTEPELPRGVRRRKRFYKITATGQEGSVTVLDPASTLWTVAAGTGAEVPLFAAAPPGANNASLTGATGERRKAI